jgi:RNA polymerase sigma factor (sigma-70 family)
MNYNVKSKMKRQNKKLNIGEELEREVERIYQLLGGSTQRRVIIKGYEIDIFAKFATGPIQFSVIVECKDYKKEKKVSDQEIRSFVAKLLAARECGKADKGVFVTTSTYTKSALSTATRHNIQCLTLEELYNQLVNFNDYIRSAIEEFSSSDLADWYIEQTGSDIEDYDSLTEQDKKKFLNRSLIQYIDKIFTKGQERRLALLGNFGTGKTCFCFKYCDVLLHRYLDNSSQRIPIIINLRDFRSGIDIHQVITNHLQQLPGIQIDLKLCLELQRMGRFFFLLDGLDEMATKVDRTVINENLREIDRLYSEYNNIYLLTCRTHFFQERIADEFLKDYRVIYLVEWGKSELEEYLKKRFGSQWDKYLEQITSTPNLEELSRTPILLDMIAKSLSKIEKDDTYKINSSRLYEAYTNEWIYQQSKRRGAVMSSQQRRKLVENLAVMLFQANRTEIHFSDLYEVAREFSGYGDPTKLDYFDTDVRTCTFITKDSNGNYGYRHRSFMEYFCASRIVNEINIEDIKTLAFKSLPEEIIYFISGMRIKEKGIECLHKWSKQFKNSFLSENAVKILKALGKPLHKEVEEHFGLSRTKFEESLWKAIVLDDEKAMNEFINVFYNDLRKMVKLSMIHLDFYNYDVDDAVQDLFLRLWTLRDNLKPKDLVSKYPRIKIWLNQIIKNLLIDRYRLSKHEDYFTVKTFKENLPDYYASRKNKELDYVEIKNIKKTVESMNLSNAAKRAFIGYYLENKSIKKISKELKLKSKTIYPMLYHVRKLLQKKLFLSDSQNSND